MSNRTKNSNSQLGNCFFCRMKPFCLEMEVLQRQYYHKCCLTESHGLVQLFTHLAPQLQKEVSFPAYKAHTTVRIPRPRILLSNLALAHGGSHPSEISAAADIHLCTHISSRDMCVYNHTITADCQESQVMPNTHPISQLVSELVSYSPCTCLRCSLSLKRGP